MKLHFIILALLLLSGLAQQGAQPDFRAPEVRYLEYGFKDNGEFGRVRAASESGALSPITLYIMSSKGDISPQVIIYVFDTRQGAYSIIWGKRKIAQVFKSECLNDLPAFDKEYWTAKVENGKISFQPLDEYKSVKALFSNIAVAHQKFTMNVNSPVPPSASPWERDIARFLNESPRDEWYKQGLLQARLLPCINFSSTIKKG